MVAMAWRSGRLTLKHYLELRRRPWLLWRGGLAITLFMCLWLLWRGGLAITLFMRLWLLWRGSEAITLFMCLWLLWRGGLAGKR